MVRLIVSLTGRKAVNGYQTRYAGTPMTIDTLLRNRTTSALSRLQIRVDGGPGGCGREARRKVLEYTLTTSAKAHGLLAPAQRGWRPTPHLRRRRGSKGQRDPVFTAASCIWSVCRQSTLICRRDRALETTGGLFPKYMASPHQSALCYSIRIGRMFQKGGYSFFIKW